MGIEKVPQDKNVIEKLKSHMAWREGATRMEKMPGKSFLEIISELEFLINAEKSVQEHTKNLKRLGFKDDTEIATIKEFIKGQVEQIMKIKQINPDEKLNDSELLFDSKKYDQVLGEYFYNLHIVTPTELEFSRVHENDPDYRSGKL